MTENYEKVMTLIKKSGWFKLTVGIALLLTLIDIFSDNKNKYGRL